MRDIDLYAQILNIQAPWTVEDVELDQSGGEVRVHVARDEAAPLECPECHQAVPGYDTRQRQWRHLDTCQLRTLLVADVPRVNCPEHGVRQIDVPWAEENSRFTALFEALVIDWLQEASIQAVSQRLGLSWDVVDGIMQRAVKRGLARRDPVASTALAVDEKAYKKRHNYLTVVSDGIRVLHVAEGRREDSLGAFFETLTPEQKRRIRWVSMDMWSPYIRATTRHLPHGARKIAFDRFHVAKQFNEAVDLVRRKEHKALVQEGDHRLKHTKYHWLRGGGPRKEAEQERFDQLRQQELRTARAWAIKETAADLWDYRNRDSARTAWQRLLGWMARSRLQPMVKLGQTVRNHLSGILNAVMAGASNSLAENFNNRIQKIKARANGFRNRQRLINAIYFHLGGLDLHPAKASLRN
jgi:transposase